MILKIHLMLSSYFWFSFILWSQCDHLFWVVWVIFWFGFFCSLIVLSVGDSYTSDKSNSYKEFGLKNILCLGAPVPRMPHLRPVSHSPDKAFGIIFTVLCFFRSCGQNTFLAGIGAPHSPMPYSLTTLYRALLEKDVLQISTRVIVITFHSLLMTSARLT